MGGLDKGPGQIFVPALAVVAALGFAIALTVSAHAAAVTGIVSGLFEAGYRPSFHGDGHTQDTSHAWNSEQSSGSEHRLVH